MSNPFESTPASRGGAYTAEESVMVNEAIRTHRATTQAAERALKVSFFVVFLKRTENFFLFFTRSAMRLLLADDVDVDIDDKTTTSTSTISSFQ